MSRAAHTGVDWGVVSDQNPEIRVVRSDERAHTRLGWLDSRHSFSFGAHYDPSNTHHGLLLVHNDDVVRAGTGFTTHPHRDMEIVTWVLEGELEHKDTLDNAGVIYPGLAQRMSAGRGIWHSEMNPRTDRDVHFVQMWVLPDTEALDPGYEQLDVNTELDRGGLVAVASGTGHDAAIAIRQEGATLWVGRLDAGEGIDLPEAPHVHFYVARGEVELDDRYRLATGDAARLTGPAAERARAGPEGAEVLVWETR